MCEYILGITTYNGINIKEIGDISSSRIYPVKNVDYAIFEASAKNKRDENGEVTEIKWFLPNITQLENMLKTYATSNPDFYTSFYWSSNTARNPNLTGKLSDPSTWGQTIDHRENPFRARATKLNSDNSHVVSETSKSGGSYPNLYSEADCAKDYSYTDADYEYGYGRTLRTQPLRVRAIRIADGVTTN